MDKWPLKPTIRVHNGHMGDPTLIEFPALHSSIQALSQNPDDLRQEGATLIHCEEFSVWSWPEESWRALLPTIQAAGSGGGGRMIVVATCKGGTFYEAIVKDQLPVMR